MALRIKRRTTGAAGPPAGLVGGELAFNEVDNTLYYGWGTASDGRSATKIIAIGIALPPGTPTPTPTPSSHTIDTTQSTIDTTQITIDANT